MKNWMDPRLAILSATRARRALRGPMRPTWTLEFEALAMTLHHYANASRFIPLKAQRGAAGSFMRPTSAIKRTSFEPVSASGVPSEWFRPAEVKRDGALLYFHGGGYSIGSIDTHRDLVSRLCAAIGVPALVPDYRLAPEHPFPAQLEDARAAYRYLQQHHSPDRIIIAGDSAGGGLTMSTLLATRDAGEALPAGAVLLSPWVDLTGNSRTLRSNDRYDFVRRPVLMAYIDRFIGGGDRRQPLVSPMFGELSDLPPLLVMAGECETLLDDAKGLARRANEAGTTAVLDVAPDMIHVYQLFGIFQQAKDALTRIAEFAAGRIPAEPTEP